MTGPIICAIDKLIDMCVCVCVCFFPLINYTMIAKVYFQRVRDKIAIRLGGNCM